MRRTAKRTVGRVIRFETNGRVLFLGEKGPVETLEQARVFLYDRIAYQHNSRTTHGTSQHAVQARLDDEQRAVWVHPQWMKTADQIEKEKTS